MRKILTALILLGLVAIALPMTAAALGLDVEAKGGAGIGLGTTDDSDISGSPRLAALGGVNIDLYLLNVGPVDLGISFGTEYTYLTFHSVEKNLPVAIFFIPGLSVTTDSTYRYLDFPLSLVCKVPVNDSLLLTVRAGAFLAYFLGGSADQVFSNPAVPSISGAKLDSSNTEKSEYGLHFTATADISLGSGLSLTPGIQFDMGLTDNTVDSAEYVPSKATFWSLTGILGIKYQIL